MNIRVKTFLIVFTIGTIIFIVGSGIYNGFQFESINQVLIEFGFHQIYAFVLGYSNLIYFDYLEKRKWEEGSGMKRIVIGIVGSLFISILGLFLIRMATSVFYLGNSFSDYWSGERFENFYFGIWATLTVVVTFHVIYFYNRHQKSKVKESQIVARTETAKFESLKNQLDPHFLFNSLNVLTSSYMQLLQMRFEDAIEYNVPKEVSDPELKIVPLSLQLLLENAVKHNVITSGNPLTISIYEERGYLVVENTVNPKASLEKSTKVGLKNIQQRYELISSNKVSIENDGKLFKVRLPLLTQKIKVMRTDYMDESAKYLRAKKKVEELKGFYGSLIAYMVVIPFLITLNYKTSWHFQWFWFPVFGWGLGLAIQVFNIYGIGGNWEERKIKQIMKKNDKYKS